MMKRALLLVDIQYDFLPRGPLSVPFGDEIIPVAEAMILQFASRGDPIFTSQDWHPAGHCSFASTHGKTVYTTLETGEMLWPDHCVIHTDGAKLAVTVPWNAVKVYKGVDINIDSYSAFYDNNHAKSTGLAESLAARRITDLYVMGLATDYCVKATVDDALDEGFNVHLIIDGCRGVDIATTEKAIFEMLKSVSMIQSAHLLSVR